MHPHGASMAWRMIYHKEINVPEVLKAQRSPRCTLDMFPSGCQSITVIDGSSAAISSSASEAL